MTKKEELIRQLKEINFYWKELSEGKSEEELEKLIQELKALRRAIKSIFNYKIMGEVD